MRSLRLLLVFLAISLSLAAPAPYAEPNPARKKTTMTTTKTTTTTTTTTKKTTTTTTTIAKATSTITTTAATTSATSARGLTCGVAGYDKTSSYNYDGSGSAANLASCSSKCNADSKCLSFAFGSGACLLYSVAATGNVNAASGSPYLFYDKACTSGTSSMTTSISLTAASTSTTTLPATSSTTTAATPNPLSSSSPATTSTTTTATPSPLSSSPTTSKITTSSTTSLTATTTSSTTASSTTTSSTTTTNNTAASSTTSSTSVSSTKSVFAHFIVGNAAGMAASDWVSDINLAKSAHIDGFALDIAAGDANINYILANAYSAAQSVGGFTLFLTFDYLSWGAWTPSAAIALINQYKTSPAQAYYQGKPLVSTFEGTGNIGDWPSIKAATGCLLLPDWSSLGPSGFAPHLSDGSADGLLSWNAWPDAANDMTTSPDQGWKAVLGSKPYMMPVAPWFYTNLPNWGKNWLWRGDDMWYQRWQQVIQFQPDLVQILTWNDYGESHYIGPTYSAGIPSGAWYVDGMPHTGWLSMLPYYIDAYKSGSLSTLGTAEKISYWYKLNPGLSGSADGTTGNNPSYQTAVSPELVTTDKIFLDVLVSEPSDVVVTIGSNTPTTLQATAAGINHFSVPYSNQVGAVTMQVKRNGAVVVSVTGPAITTTCINGNVNWNVYVGTS